MTQVLCIWDLGGGGAYLIRGESAEMVVGVLWAVGVGGGMEVADV